MFKEFSQKQKMKIRLTSKLVAIVAASALVIAGGGFVLADQFDEQIRQLQSQNDANRAASNSLAEQAESYQDAINKLDGEINGLQQAIVTTQKKSDELQVQIDANQKELDHQKFVLGQNIKAMYIEGQISTLEILASSKNLSEFVDKEQYRISVQNKVKDTVDKITALKLELESQQRTLQGLLADLEKQKADLATARDQQSQLLSFTEGQKAEYDRAIKSNNVKISELRRQQAIANAALFGGGEIIQNSRCDIYPQGWCNAPMDSIVDTWGMYNRECVSWTAYRVAVSGRYMPYWGGRGNANRWDDNARAAGIPVDGNPRVGDVAISNSGYYGHSMYVEAVHDDGTIAVSQFNHNWGGTYSFVPRMNKGNLVFIHFP
jgi:surface antigen/peptidoglycan hydrolase CwlO-like protein